MQCTNNAIDASGLQRCQDELIGCSLQMIDRKGSAEIHAIKSNAIKHAVGRGLIRLGPDIDGYEMAP